MNVEDDAPAEYSTTMYSDDRPESWAADAGTADVAQLHIPPDALRYRHFEVFCSLRVTCPAEVDDAWHALRVQVNGAQRWTRRVATYPGGADSLDYRFRHTLAVGEALRVVATSQLLRATGLGLTITAEEDRPD